MEQVTLPTLNTSLVITTYNRAMLLREALESVAASHVEDHGGVEVIVVDNNSTDHTRQLVDDILAQGFPFPLRYVFEPRQGLSHARNRGADEAAGRYLAYMDDDQRIDKDYLSRLVPAFQSTGAACIGGSIFYYNKGSLPSWVSPYLAAIGETDLGAEGKVLTAVDRKLTGGNMAFVRQELLDIGKYDVTLGRSGEALLAGEDYDLQDRLHAAGKKVIYDPALVQYHYLTPARLTKRYWRRYMFDYGRSLYRRKQLEAGVEKGSTLFSAPRWLWKNLLVREIPRAAWPLLRFDRTQSFEEQLDVIVCLGQIHEARAMHKAKAGT